MSAATLIYPHQLFESHPALDAKRTVYLVEEPLLLTFNPIHRAKLVLHKLSMDAYQQKLEEQGFTVKRIEIGQVQTTEDVFNTLQDDDVDEIHVADTVDNYLEQAIERSGLRRVWYATPNFILPKDEAIERFQASKKFMANFYKALRKDFYILMDGDEPRGGKWSFDEDNRKKIPKSETLPDDISFIANQQVSDAQSWVDSVDAEKYGDAVAWLPYTHEDAQAYLQGFFAERFALFGPYEDAMTTRGVRLWHSAISPLINIGLLQPMQVIESAIEYADEHDIPLNSLEGFVRQILGWREFIRASYEVDGGHMRNRNFWSHSNTLDDSYWKGNTGLPPVDHAIRTALSCGYNHHIDRLMVMGNVMLLAKVDPDEVYKWFMGMYLDAYDWVMVPNVYGMSQFADGGSFATKPYISGANYIKKMSDYKGGDWEATWTGLYWHFIDSNIDVFKGNHRLSMMPRILERMNEETRAAHNAKAKAYIAGELKQPDSLF